MDESRMIRVTVEEAATLLGIEKGSVKKRIQRGKLRSEKDARDITWVYLDRSETVQDQSQEQPETVRDELVGELRDRVRSLERRLDQERESRRRADTIIAQLAQANAALAARVPELEAPAEAPEDAGTVEAEQELDTERARREMAESTLHEGMDEEAHRREEAERERDDLRRELFALRQQREFTETASEGGERVEMPQARPGPQEGVRRPWWRRLLGG